MASLDTVEAASTLINKLKKTKTNREFYEGLAAMINDMQNNKGHFNSHHEMGLPDKSPPLSVSVGGGECRLLYISFCL